MRLAGSWLKSVIFALRKLRQEDSRLTWATSKTLLQNSNETEKDRQTEAGQEVKNR